MVATIETNFFVKFSREIPFIVFPMEFQANYLHLIGQCTSTFNSDGFYFMIKSLLIGVGVKYLNSSPLLDEDKSC